ncbi:MAG: 2-dehydropantoate 2-reductase [Sedimentisphaerales bacterium]|nr:2-dehydropantoate 2-reductase [Sedimentisphaerales bacterium]
MHVLIYGGGAVGLGIASCLLRSECSVDIVARPETVAALRTEGLVRTGLFGSSRAEPGSFGAFDCLAEVTGEAYDFVLVCTKSFDSARAAQDLADHQDRIGTSTRFVLFQNGWGNAEVFATRFPAQRIYNARVITGFHRHRPNEVEVTVHADAIHVGTLFGGDLAPLVPLCRSIHAGGIPCEPTDAVGKDLWAKMLYNCALNPLGAILKVSYGVLAEHATSRELMDCIIAEVFTAMSAAGHQTHWPSAAAFIRIFYERLVPDTASHRSSMLQDITAGKRTEIDALNGAVIALAEKHRVVAPYNRAVYDLVKFVEGAAA